MAPDDNDRTESMGGFDREPDRPRIERLGHFKIEATLGSGGMGTIYRAYDESMKRPVALKVLHSSLGISERAQSRFVREAWIAGQLDHPNIIKVFSRGEENNVSYLALELAEGGSLSDLVEQTRESVPSGSDVTDTVGQDYIKDILVKFIELAGALEHIHSKGFIHRDVKPQNVLLSGPDRKFKLTDFGIAHARDMTRMTQPGDFIGTVRYMSPELLAAHRAGIDKRTDIYSLGVTLYEALALTLPFKADSEEKLIGEILAGHCIEARKVNRRIPVDLETVLMKACNHDPDLRYQTAAEFAEDLQRVIDGRPVMARRPGLTTRSYKYLRRNYRMVLGIGAGAVIVVSTVLWAYYKIEQASRFASDTDSIVQEKPEPTFTKIQVPGLTRYCALSPGGERIAFVAKDSCLWVAPTHGSIDPTMAGEPIKLTEQMIGRPRISYPAWSADGEWIAFNASETVDSAGSIWLSIFVLHSAGSEAIELPVRHKASEHWLDFRISLSPDGRQIFFSSDSALVPGDPTTRCIYTTQVKGGDIRRLTDSLCGQVACSPDGKMIAYVKGSQYPSEQPRFRQSDIWVLPVEGGTPIKITQKPGLYLSPVWSPDSHMITFSKWRSHIDLYGEFNYRELYVVSLSEDYRPMSPPVVVRLPHSATDFIGGWSADHEIGLVMKTDPRGGIYTIPATGGVATQIASSQYYAPRWSPDGETMFLLGDGAIYSMPAEGGTPQVVPISGLREVSYAFCDVSPDGSKLAFAGMKKQDSFVRIFTVRVGGGEPTQLVHDPMHTYYPCWSPDGEWLAFGKRGYLGEEKEWTDNLCVMPSGGGEARVLVDSKQEDRCRFLDAQMAWSPDGESIAYVSYNANSSDSLVGISMVPFEGGSPDLLVEFEPGYSSNFVCWSPDGKKLAYCSYHVKSVSDGNIWIDGNIWVLPLDTRKPVKLRTGLNLEEVWTVAWSPDREKIAFTTHWPPERDFYLIEDFLPLSKPEGPESEPPAEPTFSMVKVPGLLDYCALSPDGQRIAFVASDSCLWVAQTRGPADTTVAGEAMRLTDPLGAYPLFCLPVWSADGNWIAFNANTLDSASSYWASMYVIASTGGELIEVPVKHDCIRSVRFWDLRIGLAPDGNDIAFFSHTSPIPGESEGDCIYAMPIRGGEITRLADSLCGRSSYCGQPAYSPDGRMLAFLRGDQHCGLVTDSAGCDIWVVSVEGGSPVQTTSLPGVEFGPVWSPDGKKIAFSQWTETEIKDVCEIRKLFVVSLSEEYQPLAPLESIDLPLPSDDFIGGWSTEGEIGLVLETAVHMAIYTVSASGGIPTMIRPSFSHCPSWSPDGERIFYLTENDVYSLPAVGGQESRIPIAGIEDLGFEGGCDLSPGGDRLVFRGLREGDSTPHLYIVPTSGGEPRQITFDSSDDWFPCWSPDANWIAFLRSVSTDDAQSHLCVVSAGGGEITELVAAAESSGFSGGKVDWSPDGKFIAYPSYHGDSLRGLSLVPSDGGPSELILTLETGRIPLYVKWSPDGQKLAYTSYRLENGKLAAEIWILPLDTRKPHRLQMTGFDLDAALEADWSPDGERIVFTGRRASRNALCLIKDLLPGELTQR